MNLLILIHSLNTGGAERVTSNLANHWAEKGWQITMVTLTSIDQDFYQLHPAVKRISLDVAGKSSSALAGIVNNLNRIYALRQVIKQVKPDVALAMMSTANILLTISTMGIKGLTTIGSERTYPPRIPLGRQWEWLRSLLYGRLDAVVALTQESATWLRQHTRAQKIVVIPNAVPWPFPQQLPNLKLPLPQPGKHLLLAVGRLSEEKGFHHLINIFKNLADDFPDWKLVILGDGPDRQALETQVSSLGLQDRIRLPGRAGNIGQWYSLSDLYVMSSRFEGFPNTLAEAMAHGLPAISFDCDTGPRDIIRHDVDGLLVAAGDITALEVALRRLMKDKCTRLQFRAKAVEVQERFSTRKITREWENLIEHLNLIGK